MKLPNSIATLFKVLVGIAFWGGLGYWLLTDSPDPGSQVVGISVVTATEDIERAEQLFFSAGVQTKIDASKEAFAKCRSAIEGVPGINCRNVTFVEHNACMVRYRKGEHTDAAVAGTLGEADAAALDLCEGRRQELDYRCVKDVEVCTDGSVNRSRLWGRAGLAIARVKPKLGGSHRVSIASSQKPSKAAATLDLDKSCENSNGKSCYDRRTFGGDLCYALAANGIGKYAFANSWYDTTGMARARENCNSQSNEECGATWLCASARSWE